ncbi:MAG: methyltransferase domain-containing protein [Bacteroidetes bacterium]|nr:methyltransferase domain-containing protein [Bacteroidota bacterium]
MQHQEAVNMLSVPGQFESGRQLWADLGCGTGTFTLALAHHLSPGSKIVAVDKKKKVLREIPAKFKQVQIEKKVANFKKNSFQFKNMDGILLANSLHYVRKKEAFIIKLKEALKPYGVLIIVEYDTNIFNPWVPFPISFERLEKTFKKAGFTSIEKIGEMPSRYNRSNLYSAIIQ